MCSPVETPVLVQSQRNLPEIASHSGLAQCDSRQTVQTPSSHSDGMVSSSRCPCSDMPQMASAYGGPVCDKVQLQTASVCVPSPQSQSMGCGCVESVLGESGPVCIPPVPLLTNVLTKALSHQCKRMIIIAPGWPYMPWFWDLVEMSSQIPICLPNRPDLLTQPFNGNLHRDLQNLNLHAPRAKAIREQGFSDQVATRIEAP